MLRAVCVCVCLCVCVTSSCSLQYIESPDVEKEVKRLLSTDAEAVSVRILSFGLLIGSSEKRNDGRGARNGPKALLF